MKIAKPSILQRTHRDIFGIGWHSGYGEGSAFCAVALGFTGYLLDPSGVAGGILAIIAFLFLILVVIDNIITTRRVKHQQKSNHH